MQSSRQRLATFVQALDSAGLRSGGNEVACHHSAVEVNDWRAIQQAMEGAERSSETNINNEIQYLERIVASQEYLARAARSELEKVKALRAPTPSDLLRARAFVHAHAGMNDEAVRELNALVSESNGNDPQVLNKLAQVRLRRQADDDIPAAKAAAGRALQLTRLTPGDQWLAHQNLALANWASGNLEEWVNQAKLALKHCDDPRTRALLAHISPDTSGAKTFASLSLPEPDMQSPGESSSDMKALVGFVSRMEPLARI